MTRLHATVVSCALVCVLASTGGAEPVATSVATAPIDSVLQWHAQAMGFDRDHADPRCFYVESTIETMGLVGSSRSWNQAPARARSVIELGPLSATSSFDGQRGWIVDRNGAVRAAEGPELESMLHEALLGDGSYLLRRPPVPLRWKKVPAEREDEIALEFTPLLGSPMHVDLDATTWLPVRLRSNSPQGEQVVEFLEWTRVEGHAVPRRSRITVAGQIEIVVTLDQARFLAPRPASFFGPDGPVELPEDVAFADGVDAVELELLGDGLHLLVQGFLGDGTPAVFLIDTGAAGNVIDQGAAERLGLESEGRIKTMGVGGAEDASFVEIESVDFGGVRIRRQSWIAADLAAVAGMFEVRPVGVLGYDFLSRLILDVDYPNRRVVLRRPGSFEAPPDAHSARLRMDSNVPSLEIVVEDVRTWVHVDTGSDGSLDLSTAFVDAHDLLEGRTVDDAGALRGVGGAVPTHRGVVHTLRIGDLVVHDVPTGFSRAKSGIFANPTVSGLLGAAFLARHRCVFDYPNKTLTLIDARD